MEIFYHSAFFIGKGIIFTLELLLGGLCIGSVLGLLAAIARYQGIARFFISRIISVLRGTPLILQLAFVYFAVPGLVGIKLDIMTAGMVTFGLNSSAYIAEILRAGIESISKGQFEAAQTLKIPAYAMWKDIILPQVIKNILPAMTSEVIALLKETALIATIGGMDIMRSAQMVSAEQFTYFTPLCVAGIYYYMLVLLIEYGGSVLEKKVQYVKR
jgi:polar amino acid transport system permease protein